MCPEHLASIWDRCSDQYSVKKRCLAGSYTPTMSYTTLENPAPSGDFYHDKIVSVHCLWKSCPKWLHTSQKVTLSNMAVRNSDSNEVVETSATTPMTSPLLLLQFETIGVVNVRRLQESNPSMLWRAPTSGVEWPTKLRTACTITFSFFASYPWIPL